MDFLCCVASTGLLTPGLSALLIHELGIGPGCRRIEAPVAHALGLVNDVLPVDQLDSCVEGWVADLSRAAPLSVRAIKEAVLRFLDMPIEQAFVTRFEWEQRRMDSRDAVECPRAFVADRKPAWQCR